MKIITLTPNLLSQLQDKDFKKLPVKSGVLVTSVSFF